MLSSAHSNRAHTTARARRAHQQRELTLQLGQLALLMGAGVGMLSSLDLGRRAAVGLVQNVIRAAHNSAVARNAPARVRIDAAEGTLAAEAMAVIGTWHFEDERLDGAFDIAGVLESGKLVDDGYIGKALAFAGGSSRTPAAEFPVQNDPSYDLSLGFAIDCVVRVDGGGGGRVLRLGETVGLDVTGTHSVKAWFVPQVADAAGVLTRGGKISLESPPNSLEVGRWTRVHVEYDRRRLVVELDGVEVPGLDGKFGMPEIAKVWQVDGPLVLAEAQQSFPCTLDNLVISAVSASEEVRLPESVHFAPDSPTEIQFDAGGNLDRGVHDGPVSLWVEFQDGTKVEIGVGMYGTVD